uniref:Uncharacterized protein n=1 Tax=Octopus bimaculoides TaxID=37653 RepID=A0A0L8HX63_OCTBM
MTLVDRPGLAAVKQRCENNSPVHLDLCNDGDSPPVSDRERWRSAVHKGANTCETNRIAAREDSRQTRKNRANNPVAGATIPCPHCKKTLSGADWPH